MQPFLKKGDQHEKELSQAWSQLGKARRELRRIEHRLAEPGRTADELRGACNSGGTDPNLGPALNASPRDHTYPVNVHRQPTARFVDAKRPSSSPARSSAVAGHVAKRKVTRLDDKGPAARSSSSKSGTRQPHRREQHVRGSGDIPQPRQGWPEPSRGGATAPTSAHPYPQQRCSSPKRVDFAQQLRLREVRWDGTYQDSIAHNAQPDPHPHPLLSSSYGSYPANSSASLVSSTDLDPHNTLTDSRAIRETDIRFLNETFLVEPLRRQDRPHPRPRARAPRLTHVDVDLPGSGSRSKDRVGAGHADSEEGRRTECGRSGLYSHHGVPLSGDNGHEDMSAAQRAGCGDMGDSSGGDSELGAVGGVDRPSSRGVSSRMQKIKKSLKDLPQDDNVLSQLREKIRQQRLSASSTDTSQNDSLGSSLPNSDTPRDSALQHDDQEHVRLAEDCGVSEKMPLSRKVAAGPGAPSYKGFSEAQLDPHLQATVNKINQLSAPKKKSGGGSSKQASDPVHNAIQAKLKAHGYQTVPYTSSSVQPASTSTPNGKTTVKLRKVTRVVAQGGKPTKSGAKNLITTSSWRAGQEVVARQLGLPKSKNREEPWQGSSSSSNSQKERRPDGAEGNAGSNTRGPATGVDTTGKSSASGGDYSAQLAQSRALSDDAKKLFSDLQLENDRVSPHLPVKRKAPKAEKDAEKPGPSEKQRHYDSESVRQFMAKQRAERLKLKTEARKAKELDQQKRQQVMQELISKQRSAVSSATSSKPKKVKRAGKGRQRVLFPSDQQNSQSFDHRIRALLGADSDKENPEQQTAMEVAEDINSDADTLTGESEGSTPRATPVNLREEGTEKPGATPAASAALPLSAVKPDTPLTSQTPSSGTTIEFHGQKLHLDVNAVLSRFSQVVSQHQGHNRRGHSGDRDVASNSEADFVPWYSRIAGSSDNFRVFPNNLPGTNNVAVRTVPENTPGSVVQTSQRESLSAAAPRNTPVTVGSFNQGLDDDSVTETSTFSEVTADGDMFEINTPRMKTNTGAGRNLSQPAESRVVNTAEYTAPAAGLHRWEDPRSDPYSVLNIFSRQQQYAVRGPSDGTRSRAADSHSQAGNLRLKDPVILSSQQVTVGQSPEGHPMMTTTTYTRMEATLPDNSQASPRSASARNRVSRSEDRPERANQSSFSSRVHSMSEDTQSLESDDEVTPKAVSSRQTSKKSVMGLRRQISDTGQETDVSQLSEDEPRVSVRSYDRPTVDVSQQETGEARWSPAALGRQMAAELARLESLEDSIRQLSSAERTRAVAMAQQETVSVAQVLKARQQAHGEELRSLQLQVQEERLASAQQLQQQLGNSKGIQAPASDMSSLLSLPPPARLGANKQLLEQVENRRPETKVTTTSLTRSKGRDDTEYTETFTSTRDTRRSVLTRSPSRSSSSPRTAEDSSSSIRAGGDSLASVKTAEDSTEFIKTAAEESTESIKTASDSEHPGGDGSAAIAEPEGDYSLSFEDSMTEDETYKKSRTGDSHRKDAKRRKNKTPVSEERSSLRVNDLTSLFGGEDSFNRFTIDIVRNIMREEEMRAQHQESLLRIRGKALKEKTKAQLSLLKQEKQQLLEKGQGESVQQELKHLADKEKAIREEHEEHKAEIDRMLKSEELAREHRQSLLKQHEHIAKMQAETQEKMQQLHGRLGRPAEVHTEDETSMVEDLSDASDISFAKDSKSDPETTQRKAKAKGDKQKMEKQQKLHLDQKYLTVREQKLLERKKQATDLLRWRKDLDAEEEKVLQLERSALQAWEGRVSDRPSTNKGAGAGDKRKERDAKREETEKKVKAPGNLRPEASARSETATTPRTPRTARTDTATTPRSAGDSYTPFSQSEAVSTHISASETDHKKSGMDQSESSTSQSRAPQTRSPQASESSIAEDIPDGSEGNPPASSPDKRMDSSDDTIVNSSVNEEEETEIRSKGKKSPVGRLLPPGNSPLPQPWSRKTGSESESEESVSHTETQSDVSDYEVRIRQLSDMLRRRRKEADMLKKERSRRMKEKLRAQEESLKKQVEAYEIYIAQVKKEQADLEQEAGKPAVPPKIKQPGPNASKTRSSSYSSPSPTRHNHSEDASYSSSFDGMESFQNSPALSEKDFKASPPGDKARKKSSSTIMDRISEGSESQSEHSRVDNKKGRDDRTSLIHSISDGSSLSEAIEEAADSQSAASDTSRSAILNIKTSEPAKADSENKAGSVMDENLSYSQDFSEPVSQSLAKSHSKIPSSIRSDISQTAPKSEVSEAIESAVSTAKSDSSAAPKFDLKGALVGGKEKEATLSTTSASSRPATGIQESDSESESRINSHRTVSRPSSERSTGSTSYSDLHDFDQEEEEDIISSESDRTPVKVSVSQKEKSSVAHSVHTEEDISEHISVSLPSISEKKSASQATGLGNQNSIDAALVDLLGEEDATPTQTPRAETPPFDQEEGQDPLMMTDPLADFHEGDRVLVWGHLSGILRFKGTVAFAPGHWAGVELNTAKGDTDGQREGKRYFSCQPDHGLLVPGSEISAAEDDAINIKELKAVTEGVKSPDESITEQDEVSSATEEESSRRVSVTEDIQVEEEEQQASTPVKVPSSKGQQKLAELADDITDDLTKSLMEDSMQAFTHAARYSSRTAPESELSPTQSPQEKVPPPTLPKPQKAAQEKVPPLTLPKPDSAQEKLQLSTPPKSPSPQEKTPPPTLPKPKSPQEKSPPPTMPKPTLPAEQQELMERERKMERQKKVENTTSSVVGNLLDDAITKMMRIHRCKTAADSKEPSMLNGFSDDSGLDPSHDSSMEPALGVSPEVSSTETEELKRPMSPEPFQRPKSPVPVNNLSEDQEDDEYDFSGCTGNGHDFFDEDFGLSAKPPPPYPGAGEQLRDSPRPAAKAAPDLFIIPHERAEVEAIVSDAVSVYWGLRRCGEPWESATAPAEYLMEKTVAEGSGEQMEGLVSASRRTFKQLVFDLTGDIVREIYQHEHDSEPPPWHKASQKRQRYFKGHSPPTTVDVLLPVVQSAITDILGLNGCSGRHRGKTTNKWNVRKKKDHVDAVLVEELQEEEAEWINYDSDELTVKMQLTDTIFDSLLADTVATLNKVYSKRQLRQQTS